MKQQLRAIVGSRVSHLDDDKATTRKVSHKAQTEEGERWATSQGYTVVGKFEDLGVSAGKTTPFERPDLGKWLTPEREHEWDVLVFSKIDRAFRSTNDCVEFARWTKENRKILAFSGDGVVLDYLHPKNESLDQMMSEFFIYVGSFFAAIELNRFRTRATDRLSYLRMTDRVSHGVPPLGFRTVPHPSGQGKALERDPEGYALLHEIKDKLLHENYSITALVKWLHDPRCLANKTIDALTQRSKPTHVTNCSCRQTNAASARGGDKWWSATTVRRVLTSERTQGIRMSEGKPVLDSHGTPIRMAEPTFTDDEWEQIQQVLNQRSTSGRARHMTDNPFAGIVYCVCGYAVAQHRRKSSSGKEHTYVRCGQGCRGAWKLADVHEQLDISFLAGYGDQEMTKLVFVPGEDRSDELVGIERSIARLRWESDNDLVDDEDLYQSRMASLLSRKREIGQIVVPARWERQGTGKTYQELWADPETDRRQVMRDARIRLVLHFIPKGSDASFVTHAHFVDMWNPSAEAKALSGNDIGGMSSD
ncbi:recombinase family protein [Mycobacteroides abscessus]|uniref:recombinase family protein n=1 Tax=Mycobacteroides abscessus TaxID=36809 RepID=UPI000C26AE76|nr:recombinase family protein [Mycobacteroides abscessus]